MATLTNAIPHGIHDDECFANQTQMVSITPHILAICELLLTDKIEQLFLVGLNNVIGEDFSEEKAERIFHQLDEFNAAQASIRELLNLIAANNRDAFRAEQEFHDKDKH